MQQRGVAEGALWRTPHAVTAAWWPLRCKFGSAGAGAESPLSRLQLVRGRLALGALGWLDPAADPDPGPSAEMRACGDLRDWARAPGGDLLLLFVRYGRWA
jgi:hypothetical protein